MISLLYVITSLSCKFSDNPATAKPGTHRSRERYVKQCPRKAINTAGKQKTYSSDEVRRSHEALGTPKGVIEVSTMTFKLSCKTTIYDSITTALAEQIIHNF